MSELVQSLDGLIWSAPLIYLCLGAGLYFSIRTRFMQVRGFKEMLRLTTSGKTSAAGVSSFQALAMSLSGRIGVGNIAGIATAIAAGGPGAIFWMWAMAFLGASTSYIECTLAQIYKQKDDHGQYRGGPAYYIEKGMGQRWYAIAFAISTIVGTGLLLPTVQSYEIASSVGNAWGVPSWISGLLVVIGLGVIIVGGVRRIATFAEIVVPFMAMGYMIMAAIVMALNAEQVPVMFALIMDNAFNPNAAFGAILGLAVQWGVKRGIYANEAGQGTGPHAAAAAEVSHPAKQGYVQAFSIYFDTAIVCTSTAFMILSTGKYNVIHPETGAVLAENLPRVTNAAGELIPAPAGSGYTQAAIESVFSGFGASFVALAILFFAFTTIVAYYYMAETNLEYIARNKAPAWSVKVLKALIMASVGFGAVWSSEGVWALGSVGVGLMAWINVIAIIILQKPALLALKDYEAQKKAGLDPTFDPDKVGIRNAEIWKEIGKGSGPAPAAVGSRPGVETP
ncbi:AGCS family alanine or glycine:cation symporter [Povalibacter uvarum]|uniref:AGCS family alanine or glycine:cation symporter n=1 Tax=Povalibacter uvarum TaxID=732238 RepID=A0A841HKX2_9GAMM|nr:alanine/glycine:cation symporter family protein [Povalibacter uvarum]MBB6093707.1 AGCS family alanine or glycine:cation symporter [Povalibacter uvarum]